MARSPTSLQHCVVAGLDLEDRVAMDPVLPEELNKDSYTIVMEAKRINDKMIEYLTSMIACMADTVRENTDHVTQVEMMLKAVQEKQVVHDAILADIKQRFDTWAASKQFLLLLGRVAMALGAVGAAVAGVYSAIRWFDVRH